MKIPALTAAGCLALLLTAKAQQSSPAHPMLASQTRATATSLPYRHFERVSVATDGTQGNGDSYAAALSDDGRFIAFTSVATNLVPADTNGARDVFVHDHLTGTTTRESVGSGGVQANGNSYGPQLSADGRYVAFVSNATNLARAAGNQAYVRDRLLGQTTLASVSTDGTTLAMGPLDISLSADGRFLAFESDLLIRFVNGVFKTGIFVHDMLTSATTREDVSSDGAPADDQTYAPSISGDGRFVAFYSYCAALAPVPVNPWGSASQHIFVRDRLARTTTVEDFGAWPSISRDGRLVAFNGAVGFGGYLRDREAHETFPLFHGSEDVGSPRLSADARFVSFVRIPNYYCFSCPLQWFVEVFDRLTRQYINFGEGGRSSSRAGLPVAGNIIAFDSAVAYITDDTNGATDVFITSVISPAGAPNQPTELAHTLTGQALRLTWVPPAAGPRPEEYVIEVGSFPHGIDLGVFPTGSTRTELSTIFNGDNGGQNFVRVRSANRAGAGLQSNEIQVLPRVSGAPRTLSAIVTGFSVTLSWSAANLPVISYIIEAGSASGLADLANFSTGTTATSFTANGVPSGTYFVRARGIGPGGAGPPSNEVTVIVR